MATSHGDDEPTLVDRFINDFVSSEAPKPGGRRRR